MCYLFCPIDYSYFKFKLSFIAGELMRSKLWMYLSNTDFSLIANDLVTDMDLMFKKEKFEKAKIR